MNDREYEDLIRIKLENFPDSYFFCLKNSEMYHVSELPKFKCYLCSFFICNGGLCDPL